MLSFSVLGCSEANCRYHFMFCFSNENEICFVSSPELKFPEFLDVPVFSEYPSVHRDFDSLAMGRVNNTDVEFGSGGGDQMVLDGQGLVCLSLFYAIAIFILHPQLKLGFPLACHCQFVS